MSGFCGRKLGKNREKNQARDSGPSRAVPVMLSRFPSFGGHVARCALEPELSREREVRLFRYHRPLHSVLGENVPVAKEIIDDEYLISVYRLPWDTYRLSCKHPKRASSSKKSRLSRNMTAKVRPCGVPWMYLGLERAPETLANL